MTPTGTWTDPAPIAFNSAGSEVTIAADYTVFFNHPNPIECPVFGCAFKSATDCNLAFTAQTDVTITASPAFGLAASEIKPLGYTRAFCYRCSVAAAGGPIFNFDYSTITVSAPALVCSGTLSLNPSYGLPPAIPYNAAGSTGKVVHSGYTVVMDHANPTDCLIQGCVLLDNTAGTCSPDLSTVTSDVYVDSAYPFGIYQTEKNILGYEWPVCYKCSIKTWGTNNIWTY